MSLRTACMPFPLPWVEDLININAFYENFSKIRLLEQKSAWCHEHQAVSDGAVVVVDMRGGVSMWCLRGTCALF